MRNYDLTLIFSPLLKEEETNDLFQQFVSFVQDQGGILEDQRILGKKPLLSPIRHFTEGYLSVVTCSLDEKNLPSLEKKCREIEHIIRFFIMRQVKKTKKTRTARVSAPTPSLSAPQKKEEKIDLQDIDQKLEEIFSEKS